MIGIGDVCIDEFKWLVLKINIIQGLEFLLLILFLIVLRVIVYKIFENGFEFCIILI